MKPYKSADLSRRYKFTDDPVDHIRSREEVNKDLLVKFISGSLAAKPGAESQQAVELE